MSSLHHESILEDCYEQSYESFKKIEASIIDSYELLSNPEDQEVFYDYLIANYKLLKQLEVRVRVMPIAHDGGTSIGAAYLAHTENS